MQQVVHSRCSRRCRRADDLAYKMHLFAMHEEHVEGLFDRPVDPSMYAPDGEQLRVRHRVFAV